MKKSFKKAIAVLLTVLMAAFSMPFTALAAPGDYNPNINLLFGTFHDASMNTSGAVIHNWTDYTFEAAPDFNYSGLYDAPLTYNQKAGTLTLTKNNADQAADILLCDTIDADYQYGVGDYFTVTVSMENIDSMAAAMLRISYSDSIEPAGLYSYQSGRQKITALGTVSEAVANGGTFSIGGTLPVEAMSASSFYNNALNFADGKADDTSDIKYENIKTEKPYMDIQIVSANGKDVDVSEWYDEYFANPETGDLSSGYTYKNQVLIDTFVFKIVNDGPIEFSMADPDGSIFDNDGGSCCLHVADGTRPENLTTYGYTIVNGVETVGSRKMTFMGTNVNWDTPEPTSHTITFVNAAGETVDTQEVEDGVVPTAPANTAADYDETNHYTYSWPALVAATEDATYNEVKTTTAHSFTATVTKEATCKEAGTTNYACDCGYAYDDTTTPAATGNHTPGTPVETIITEATCGEAGSKKVVISCTVCGDVISEDIVEIPATGNHTPGTPVETVITPATCETKGSKRVVTTCTVCGAEISNEVVEITELGHDWELTSEKVEPTAKEDGHEAIYTCKNDPTHVSGGDVIPALGINITVTESDLGDVTGLVYGTNKVAYGDTYSVTATAIEGATFKGWEINGKIVTTEATYSSAALNDVTLTPIFTENGTTISVIFYDKYANVIETITGTVDEVKAALATLPTAPVYTGYTFTGWSMSDEEIANIQTSTAIYAQYELAREIGYTVTTTGEVVLPAGVENGSIPYDTLVTVKAEGATAWKVGDAVVGYGEEYSFFVGADITVEPVFDSVTAKPTATIIKATQVTGSYKVEFLATRNVPEGFKLVNAGFVYGKNLTDAELNLDNVGKTGEAANAGTVKVAYASQNGADQFALSYGITAMNANACAKAFVVYQVGDQVVVEYSNAEIFTY